MLCGESLSSNHLGLGTNIGYMYVCTHYMSSLHDQDGLAKNNILKN